MYSYIEKKVIIANKGRMSNRKVKLRKQIGFLFTQQAPKTIHFHNINEEHIICTLINLRNG